ncbi:MAG: hypothetical protein QM831_15075 [Kofleriaceae bacterium]
MRGWVRHGVIVSAAVAACRFSPGDTGTGSDDGGLPPADAGPCQTLESECANDTTLRTCTTLNQMPVDTACTTWGCAVDGPGSAHCRQLVPTGTGATSADLDPDPTLSDITLGNNDDIDTDQGTIGGAAVPAGATWKMVNGYSIFRAKSWHLTQDITVRGTHPLVLVALTDVTIDHDLDLRGDCTPGTSTSGPGGFDGAATGDGDGKGPCGGIGGPGAIGGGGGGHGGSGGSGGSGQAAGGGAGGTPYVDDTLAVLVGGCGGGAGGVTGSNGLGGGGGGAVQIVANGAIKLTRMMGPFPGTGGAINASGCGGTKGDNSHNGGGGGGGGAILLEAKTIDIQGFAAVNGGGGGAGGVGANGMSGEKGQASRQAANGGSRDTNDNNDGSGGDGAAGSNVNGSPGVTANHSGGGGGGVGIMRFNSQMGSASVGANNLSPNFDDPGTHTTQGSAHVQ